MLIIPMNDIDELELFFKNKFGVLPNIFFGNPDGDGNHFCISKIKSGFNGKTFYKMGHDKSAAFRYIELLKMIPSGVIVFSSTQEQRIYQLQFEMND